MTRRSTRNEAGSDSRVRPGVAAIAAVFVLAAVGLFAYGLSGGDVRGAEASATASRAGVSQRDTEPAALPTRALPAPTAPAKERPEPFADLRWAPQAKRAQSARPVARAVTNEPQWDGKGTPSREYVRWVLENLVSENHQHGSVSGGALDGAVDDALELYEANRALLTLQDPAEIEAARETAKVASEALSSTLGFEVDMPAYQ